jgi:hypothetical protein
LHSTGWSLRLLTVVSLGHDRIAAIYRLDTLHRLALTF